MNEKVKSLAKAMEVLECFSVQNPELGVSEIARMTGLQKSSVHNMLSTFEHLGYVGKNPATSRYHLGLKLVAFSYIITSHMGLNQLMMPYLKRIANAVHETVYLGIPAGSEVLYIESCVDDAHHPSRNILGERAPMYCTGIGKVMLAHHEDPLSLLSGPLLPFTDHTITDRGRLLADLETIRQRGYAVDNMEHEYGIKCVALPLFGANRRLRCAVSASGPSLRFSDDQIADIARQMEGILREIQYSL